MREPQATDWRSRRHRTERTLRYGWYVAVASGTMTLLTALAGLAGSDRGRPSGWILADVVIIYAIAFGMAKRRRLAFQMAIASVLLWRAAEWVEHGPSGPLVIGGLILLLFYGRAYRALGEWEREEHERLAIRARLGLSQSSGADAIQEV